MRLVLLIMLSMTAEICAAANSYQLNAAAMQDITEHGACAHVENDAALAIFIPTKSAQEWLAFRNNPPTNVTIGSCTTGGYVNSSNNGAATGNLTLTVPTGTKDNHVMIASLAVRPNTTTITAPAGWTLIRNVQQAGGTASQLATYRRVAASEPANYTWTFSGVASTGAAGGITTFFGMDTTTPVDVENGAATASALTHATPSVTTTVANAMLVTAHEYTSATNDWTAPTGMTEAVDAASIARPNGVGISMEMNYLTQAAAGATGTKTATADGTGAAADTGAAQIVAVRPLSTPVAQTITVTTVGSTDNIVAHSVYLTGTAAGIEATGSNQVTGAGPITTNITTLTNNAMVVDMAGCGNTGTFTPGAGQTERQDANASSSSGALSTKPVATAGATTVQQTHTGANRLAHVAVAVAQSGTLAYDSTATGSANATNTVSFTHNLPGTSGKLIVGIAVEDPTCTGNQNVSSVTFASTNLTFAVGINTATGGFCERAEIWYMDVL